MIFNECMTDSTHEKAMPILSLRKQNDEIVVLMCYDSAIELAKENEKQ